MGIIIYELNLFFSTTTRGITGNVPVIIMYGREAVSFLSFFASLGAVMIPIIIPEYVKNCFPGGSYKDPVLQLLIALGLILYISAFLGFYTFKRELKFKLTSRIAIIVTVAVGYMLSLLAGIVDNVAVTLILLPFTGFAYGLVFNILRDYRINAGRLGYEEFSDTNVHSIQYNGYFLGVCVGSVIAGICFERFGLLIVNIISGAIVIIASLGIVYFMKDNAPVRESALPVNKWLELVSDKFAGRFLTSTFFSMGIIISFLLCFIPNYLDTVGISLATSSFYYLVAAFSALFIGYIIRERYSYALTSRLRVIISSFSAMLGLILFALMPTAKMLFVTCLLVGLGLGIHGFKYLYVLYLLTNSRFKSKYNLRRACEASFLFGVLIAIPVFALSVIFDIRIVFIIALVFFFICAFIYPLSQFSSTVDDRDKNEQKNPAPQSEPVPAVVYPSNMNPDAIVMSQEAAMDVNQQTGFDSHLDVNSFIDDIADNLDGGYDNGRPLE